MFVYGPILLLGAKLISISAELLIQVLTLAFLSKIYKQVEWNRSSEVQCSRPFFCVQVWPPTVVGGLLLPILNSGPLCALIFSASLKGTAEVAQVPRSTPSLPYQI